MLTKQSLNDLALFGGKPAIASIRSTSNLVQPDVEQFFKYARVSFLSRRLTNNGPLVQLLEQRLADLHRVDYCVACCSGFWSLVLTMRCLARPRCADVVMPSLTYRRLADVAAWLQLTPYFCDIDQETLAPGVAEVEQCLTNQTALLLMPHPIVHVADIAGLTSLASRHHLPIVFDSVEAAFASYQGRMIGSFGNAECFSMHASKLLNGFEAGYVTTDDADLAAKLRKMRAFGFLGQDNVDDLGLNAKLNEVHAAMALASLDDLPGQLLRNRARYAAYCNVLRPISGIRLVQYDEVDLRGFKNILVELTESWPLTRTQTMQLLHAENMLARPYYSPPLHEKPTTYATKRAALPVTARLRERYLLLPCGHFLNDSEIAIIGDLLRFLQDLGREIAQHMERQ